MHSCSPERLFNVENVKPHMPLRFERASDEEPAPEEGPTCDEVSEEPSSAAKGPTVDVEESESPQFELEPEEEVELEPEEVEELGAELCEDPECDCKVAGVSKFTELDLEWDFSDWIQLSPLRDPECPRNDVLKELNSALSEVDEDPPEYYEEEQSETDSEKTFQEESLSEKVDRLRETWLERDKIQNLRFQKAKKEENQQDLRTLYLLAQNNFSKFDDLSSRVAEEATKLEACTKALEELKILSNKASMDAKSALKATVFKPEKEQVLPQKEVLPEDTDQIYTSTLGLGILSTLGILSPVAPEIAAQLKDLSFSVDWAPEQQCLSLCDFSEHRDPSLSAKYEKQLSFTAEHMMAFSESLSYLSALDWYAQSQDQWLSGISERLSYLELRVDRGAGDPFDVFRHLTQDIADFDERAGGSMVFKVFNPQADDQTLDFKYEWDLLVRTALLALSNEIFYYRLLLVARGKEATQDQLEEHERVLRNTRRPEISDLLFFPGS
ncbi:hypothetical protein AK812_SmicGene3151 [Symbiodinium microadriaticum]|uniref:Uncharacterized protein n=1 Tax=Symbiodinium microadriaticum TaxID=2951 RepID=A0A1Q9EZI4_SYMMI|nr:hypothetical protein AK812_SmicGene3151 [Symbiodinium microadriaticum]